MTKKNLLYLHIVGWIKIEIALFFQVIEIPKGSKVKYELDKKTGLIKVSLYPILYRLWDSALANHFSPFQSLPRLIVYCTHQLSILTITVSFPEPFAKITTQWMS